MSGTTQYLYNNSGTGLTTGTYNYTGSIDLNSWSSSTGVTSIDQMEIYSLANASTTSNVIQASVYLDINGTGYGPVYGNTTSPTVSYTEAYIVINNVSKNASEWSS